MELALDGTRGIRELIHEGTYEAGGVISPDGRWLAYESDASGPTEVSVCSYPEITTWCAPVTTGGAGAPRWLPGTGRELFFVTLEGALMRAKVDFTGGAPQFALPMKVLDLLGWNSYGSYDVARNGRIVVIKHMASPPEVNVVLNWNLELAQRVPMK
jgi:Tol biopolymer transport system component